MTAPNLYRQILVWKHLEGQAVRYCCFQELGRGRYCVQSADFFRTPIKAEDISVMNAQIAELFIEVEPAVRCSWFDTLQMAIEQHDRQFSG